MYSLQAFLSNHHVLICFAILLTCTNFHYLCRRDGAIPTVTLIMGGNLLRGSNLSPILYLLRQHAAKFFIRFSTSSGLHGSGTQFSVIIGVIAVRYVMLPLIGMIIVKGAIRLGLVHSDPLYQFVLLLQYALPPAMNMGIHTYFIYKFSIWY